MEKIRKKLRCGKFESDDKKMEHFVQQFSLSKRECEVLETLLKSDKKCKRDCTGTLYFKSGFV